MPDRQEHPESARDDTSGGDTDHCGHVDEPVRDQGSNHDLDAESGTDQEGSLRDVAANRTGLEPDPSGVTGGIAFWGSSFVAGPQGEVLARAGEIGSQVLIASLDLDHAEAVRRIWPYLRDRRIDAYEGLLRRYLD